MHILTPGRPSPHTYCGSRIWVDFSKEGPLVSRLFEYWGTCVVGGETLHKFKPYRRLGGGMLLSDKHLQMVIDDFRPLILDMEALGLSNSALLGRK